ncbi:MAG: inositol monophosphatase family protein [Hyphomicrobiaceae bacterium]|nr:inositol monophosphatase family protein [Hyphomicrobiaceae bacterium]
MAASPLLNVMIAAARKAGRGLARDFGEVEQLQVSIKGPGNFVTAADHRSEETLYRELSKARPGYAFLMEERGTIEGSDKTHRWIVDPLDGTTNFLHGIPLFCIAIGLEREGELVAGVLYNPVLDELYAAEKGRGAYLNNRRLRVAQRKTLADCVISIGIPHRGRGNPDVFVAETRAIIPHVSGLRRSGSACVDLAWVASGRFDAYYEYDLQAWDIAAGTLIVREAGGLVTDLDGSPDVLGAGDILAANPAIHKALAAILKGKA